MLINNKPANGSALILREGEIGQIDTSHGPVTLKLADDGGAAEFAIGDQQREIVLKNLARSDLGIWSEIDFNFGGRASKLRLTVMAYGSPDQVTASINYCEVIL